MFTRIMDTLKTGRENVSKADIDLDDSEFPIKDFPCSDITQLQKLNQLCDTKPNVTKILVRNILNNFSVYLLI